MNEQKTNIQLPFYLLTAAIFMAVLLPGLIQDGMFMDGVLYTSVAHNLANGLGTFWEPYFSTSWLKDGVNSFHEHPPLVFGIQSIFFKIFGSSIYVERFYSLLMAILTAFFIHKIWRLIFSEAIELQKMSWLPIFFWITIPVCFWSYQNNMQENTMGLFSIIAIYFGLQFVQSDATKWSSLLWSGVFIFLSAFSKGVPGLFPLAFIGIYWICHFNFSFFKMILATLILILIPVAILSVFYFTNEAAANGLTFYTKMRLMGRVDAAPTVDSRFYIVGRLLSELLPMIIFGGFLLFTGKISIINTTQKIDYRKAGSFLLLGISAALPMMLTLVQKGFYLTPSFPYFALGVAMIYAPGIADLISKIDMNGKIFKQSKIVVLLFITTSLLLSFNQIGKTKKDAALLGDVYKIGELIPPHSTISIEEKIWSNWSLQTYLIRHFFISVDKKNGYPFLLILKNNSNFPKGYVPINAPLSQFTLLKKVD